MQNCSNRRERTREVYLFKQGIRKCHGLHEVQPKPQLQQRAVPVRRRVRFAAAQPRSPAACRQRQSRPAVARPAAAFRQRRRVAASPHARRLAGRAVLAFWQRGAALAPAFGTCANAPAMNRRRSAATPCLSSSGRAFSSRSGAGGMGVCRTTRRQRSETTRNTEPRKEPIATAEGRRRRAAVKPASAGQNEGTCVAGNRDTRVRRSQNSAEVATRHSFLNM